MLDVLLADALSIFIRMSLQAVECEVWSCSRGEQKILLLCPGGPLHMGLTGR